MRMRAVRGADAKRSNAAARPTGHG
ncbi:uncharacterized protein METZ01_LOCUS148611, partial [marine metagenome]